MPVDGQGEFRQPPADNYNLPLDPYRAASSFVMFCTYVDGMTSFDYNWTKDGANFQHSEDSVGDSVLATVPVPNGEYLSSLEGTYTCRVLLGGITRGSRNIIVTLPGEPWPVCTSPTSHTHAQSCKGSVTYYDHLLVYTVRCKTLRFPARLQHCVGSGSSEVQHTEVRCLLPVCWPAATFSSEVKDLLPFLLEQTLNFSFVPL